MANTAAMTINVDRDEMQEFRKMVASVYGTTKGSLSRAVTEAIVLWKGLHKKKSAEATFWEMVEKGYNLGGITYKHRSELYDRR